MLSVLAGVSGEDGVAGLIDPGNAFDPASAAAFGVDLSRLLWVRSGRTARRVDQALKIADLLLQGGGFGLIVVDLSDLPSGDVRRVPASRWVRLRRAARNTPTIVLFLNRESTLKTAAALALRMEVARIRWSARFLSEVRPGARVVRSRYDPSSSRQTCLFRLYPLALIEAGRPETEESSHEPDRYFQSPAG